MNGLIRAIILMFIFSAITTWGRQITEQLIELNKKTCIIEQTNRFGNLNIESHGEIILYEDIKMKGE